MQGPPGSGKSTVVKQLMSRMDELKISNAVFSTDDFFMKDGIYQFDFKLLGINHTKNLEAASTSPAHVVIIDNTNLTPGEYARYKSKMLNRIVIILSCKVENPEMLIRNIHGVPLEHIKKMCAKYTIAVPAYIGGFVSHNNLSIWSDKIKQIQPLHITERFIGGDKRKLKNFDFDTLCQQYPFDVTGVSTSTAGIGLVCNADIHSESTPHITIAVNDGFKPADVGKEIAEDNVNIIDPPIKLTAVRLPMF
jgi:hypothetical protein